MTTKIATSFGLALILAMGILATMLALGMFTASKVSATDDPPAQIVLPAEAGGVLAEYRFTFTVTGSMSPGVGEIRITFDKDTIMPATISRSNVLISASRLSKHGGTGAIGATGAAQFVGLDVDPVIESDIADPRKKVVKIKVPDMNPNNVGEGVGAQGIGVGYFSTAFPDGGTGSEILGNNSFHDTFADVTVIFTTAAGIKTPAAAEISGAKIMALDTVAWNLSTNLVTGIGAAVPLAVPLTAAQIAARTEASARGDVQTQIKRTLRLSGVEGARGSSLTLTAKGFTAGQTATLWRDANADGFINTGELELGKVTVGTDGSFSTSVAFNNPPFKPGTAATVGNFINAIDGRGNTVCPSDTVTLTAGCRASTTADNEVGNVKADLPTFKLTGKVSVTPTTAAVGDTIQIKVEDFPANLALSNSLTASGGVSISGQAVTVPPNTTTDGNGEKTFEAKVPNGVPTGVAAVAVLEGTSTRRATITITGAVITLTPTTAVPNQTISLIGRGYSTGGAATINALDDTSVVSIGGSTTNLKAAGDAAAGGLVGAVSAKINDNKTITVDNGGNWSASLVVPINATTTTAGTHELKVLDNLGRDGTVNLVIPARTLVLTPASGRLGTTVAFTGTGYPANNTGSGADTTPSVSITYSVPGETLTVATATPDSSGNISGTFTVPLKAGIPSTNAVRAEYKFDNTTVTTTGVHDVPKAEITVSPTSGPPGTKVTITASGFKTFSTTEDLKIGTADVKPSPVPQTDDKGDLSAVVTVPQLDLGVATVTAKVGGTTASTSFTVTVTPPAPPPPPAPAPVTTVAPATGLAPLGTNLVRTWGYDAATQKFQLYDPAAALLSDLTALNRGAGYWINVKTAQTVTLGTGSYSLSAGWNLVGWLG